MFEKKNSHLPFLIAISIGMIGAIGQSLMLRHELIDCYPYKIMSFPPADFYKNIANVGVFVAPFVAIIGGFLSGRIKFWFASIIPVVLCPILFSLIYKAIFLIRQSKDVSDVGRNFDGTLLETVAQSFFTYSVELSVIGLIIGAGCGFLVLRFFTTEKFI